MSFNNFPTVIRNCNMEIEPIKQKEVDSQSDDISDTTYRKLVGVNYPNLTEDIGSSHHNVLVVQDHKNPKPIKDLSQMIPVDDLRFRHMQAKPESEIHSEAGLPIQNRYLRNLHMSIFFLKPIKLDIRSLGLCRDDKGYISRPETNRRIQCLECGGLFGHKSHHQLYSCNVCGFTSVCRLSVFRHQKKRHRIKLLIPKNLKEACVSDSESTKLLCSCKTFSTISSLKMASHLLTCQRGRKTCRIIEREKDASLKGLTLAHMNLEPFKEVPVYLKDTIQLSVREKLVKKILCKGSQSDNHGKTDTSEAHSKHIPMAGSHQQAGVSDPVEPIHLKVSELTAPDSSAQLNAHGISCCLQSFQNVVNKNLELDHRSYQNVNGTLPDIYVQTVMGSNVQTPDHTSLTFDQDQIKADIQTVVQSNLQEQGKGKVQVKVEPEILEKFVQNYSQNQDQGDAQVQKELKIIERFMQPKSLNQGQGEVQVHVEPQTTESLECFNLQPNLRIQNEGQVKVEPQITENGMQQNSENKNEGQVKVEPQITENCMQWNLGNQNEGQVKVEPQITESGIQWNLRNQNECPVKVEPQITENDPEVSLPVNLTLDVQMLQPGKDIKFKLPPRGQSHEIQISPTTTSNPACSLSNTLSSAPRIFKPKHVTPTCSEFNTMSSTPVILERQQDGSTTLGCSIVSSTPVILKHQQDGSTTSGSSSVSSAPRILKQKHVTPTCSGSNTVSSTLLILKQQQDGCTTSGSSCVSSAPRILKPKHVTPTCSGSSTVSSTPLILKYQQNGPNFSGSSTVSYTPIILQHLHGGPTSSGTRTVSSASEILKYFKNLQGATTCSETSILPWAPKISKDLHPPSTDSKSSTMLSAPETIKNLHGASTCPGHNPLSSAIVISRHQQYAPTCSQASSMSSPSTAHVILPTHVPTITQQSIKPALPLNKQEPQPVSMVRNIIAQKVNRPAMLSNKQVTEEKQPVSVRTRNQLRPLASKSSVYSSILLILPQPSQEKPILPGSSSNVTSSESGQTVSNLGGPTISGTSTLSTGPRLSYWGKNKLSTAVSSRTTPGLHLMKSMLPSKLQRQRIKHSTMQSPTAVSGTNDPMSSFTHQTSTAMASQAEPSLEQQGMFDLESCITEEWQNGNKEKLLVSKAGRICRKKRRLKEEDEDYVPNMRIKKKSKITTSKKKKRRFTAYSMFCKSVWNEVVATAPSMDFGQLSKRFAEQWNELPPRIKLKWKRKAKKEQLIVNQLVSETDCDPAYKRKKSRRKTVILSSTDQKVTQQNITSHANRSMLEGFQPESEMDVITKNENLNFYTMSSDFENSMDDGNKHQHDLNGDLEMESDDITVDSIGSSPQANGCVERPWDLGEIEVE